MKCPMADRVKFKTADGVTIIGNYYSAAGTRGVLLLHMMPATKESWDSFAQKIQRTGFAVLTIDLRGHGESDGGPDGFRSFTDVRHQASIHDVEAAAEFLKSKGTSELYLGGASIGANLALWYASEHTDVRALFLLSPGLDYRGIKAEFYTRALQPAQAVYFIGDEDDMRKSGDSAAHMAKTLFDATKAQKKIQTFEGSGHGTDMFMAHPDFEETLIRWLVQ